MDFDVVRVIETEIELLKKEIANYDFHRQCEMLDQLYELKESLKDAKEARDE